MCFIGFMSFDRYKKNESIKQENHDYMIEMRARIDEKRKSIQMMRESPTRYVESNDAISVAEIDTFNTDTNYPEDNRTMLGDDGEYHGRLQQSE